MKRKIAILLVGYMLCKPYFILAQVSIGIKKPDPSAMLEIKSDSKGVLISRMTAKERNSIDKPAEGLLVYQIDESPGFYFFSGNSWKSIQSSKYNSGGFAMDAATTNVVSVSGTTNRITSTGGTNPVIDIALNYPGQSSITTLGTISSGIWNASVIPALKGGAGNVNGLLKANGIGVVSAAVKGSDYALPLKLTTIGTAGPASYNATTGILNVPNYAGSTGANSYVFNSPLLQAGTTVSLLQSSSTSNGFLSSSDWKTFNEKLSTVSAAAIYAPLNSPSFTGFVSGINRNMVGLGNVDNTSDLNKPLSNAMQTALDSKADKISGSQVGDMLIWNGTSWVKLPVGQENESLIICNGKPVWGGCTPTVSTNEVSSIGAKYATYNATLTNTGGTYLSKRGFVWDSLPMPVLESANMIAVEGTTGQYSSTISGLIPNTTYFIRSFATNQKGTAYGNEVSFTTSSVDLESGLVAYLPFKGNAMDSSSYQNHGLVHSASLSTDRFGNSNAAYYFNGNSSISIPHNASLNLTSFTICSWVFITNPDNPYNEVLTKGSDANENYEHLIYGNPFPPFGGTECAVRWTDGSRGLWWCMQVDNQIYASPNNWNFILTSYDVTSGILSTYINGQLSYQANPQKIPQFNSNDLYIGADPSVGRYFTGTIDDVRIYNRALKIDEINYLSKH